MKGISFSFFAVIILSTLISRSGEQISVDNAPRIITNDGNLMFQAGISKAIHFETQGNGDIKFNDINIKEFYGQMKDVKSFIIQHKNDVNNFNRCDCNVMKLTISTNTQKIINLREKLEINTNLLNTISTIVHELKQKSTVDECVDNPCHNGGTCIDGFGKYNCICTKQYTGRNCMEDVNECSQYFNTDIGCQNNARCENTPGGFKCICVGKWSGVLCNIPTNGCSGSSNAALCGHGSCISDITISNTRSFNCLCDSGWSLDQITKTCILDNDECTVGRYPCSENPRVPCYNTPGGFTCGHCPAGYTGNGFSCTDVNECLNTNICGINQRCINNQGSYQCQCVDGMTFNQYGVCHRQNICLLNNGGCNINAQCSSNPYFAEGRICDCNRGYVGNGVGPSGCVVNPSNNTRNYAYYRCIRKRMCKNGGTCQRLANGFSCRCTPLFDGNRCRIRIVNRCLQNPCNNGGSCIFLHPNNYNCKCTPHFTGINCETEHTECGGTIISPRNERNITLMVSSSSYRYPCQWIILVSEEQFIQVKPIVLQLFGPCNTEYIQILEKSSSDSESRELGKYCEINSQALNNYNSTAPILIIKAQLRNTNRRPHGFTINIKPLNYITQNVDCCRCLNSQPILTNKPTGIFQSPHYPLSYPGGINCIMQYERTFGQKFKVALTINTGDLGDSNGNCSTTDYIKITYVERGATIITACNQALYQNQQFITSGFKIEFYSDLINSQSLSRFKLQWRKTLNEDPCGGIISFQNSGAIHVQSIPASEEAYCTWIVHRSNVSQLISLKGIFTNWPNGDCSVYIKILNIDLNGNTRLLWEQCQNSRMIDYIREEVTGKLIIIFRKATGVSTPTFRVDFKYLCGKVINMDELTSFELTSSNYPSYYENDLNCIYTFVARTRKFTINFVEMDIVDDYNCRSDYILIRGASRLYINGRYCNGNQENLIPIDKLPSSTNLVITFKTNSSISGRGFKANVTLFECGGSYYVASRQIIAYPENHFNNTNSDISYSINKNCIWNLISPPGSYIFAIFDHFHLEHHNDCQYDYLSVSYDNVTDRRYCGTFIPNIYTRSNRLKLVFRSDFSVGGEGFIMRVYVGNLDNHCHQQLTVSDGIITNPPKGTQPRPYICIYSITVPVGRKVVINVTIETSLNSSDTNRNIIRCYGKGRLRIKDIFVGSLSYIEICPGSPQQGLITTSANKATIVYYVPSYGTLSEFNFTINFRSIDEECGAIHVDDYGDIASPNYPLYAPVNTYCQWEIRATPGRQIRIKIISIKSGSISETKDCNRYNNPVIKLISLSQEISIFCETHTNKLYNFNDEIVRIIFKNYGSTQYRFRLTYRKVCTFKVVSTYGRIESNNRITGSSESCSWKFNLMRGTTLNLQFYQFDLPNFINGVCKAFVKITDSNTTLLPNSCGSTLINNIFQSKNYPIIIKHYVSSSIPYNILQSHRGFILEYNTQGCIYNINYDPNDLSFYNRYQNLKGSISSPQYPDTISNIDCIWSFKTVAGSSIKLKFNVIELDSFVNCSEGYILQIRESENINSPYVFKSCSKITANNNPLIFQSSTNYLYLIFLSANDINGGKRKFQADYEFINTSCEYEITANHGIIKSPNYPNVYPRNINCKWNLSVRQGMSIFLKFLDFEIEGSSCQYDYVQIFSTFNAETMPITRLCGTNLNTSRLFESISNKMLITFITDSSVQRRGFKAEFFEGCGGQRNATEENQFLESPNYPHHYAVPYNICEWTITANLSKPGERIFFYFLGFESHTGDINGNCSLNMNSESDNSITIIDGLEETPIKAKLCSNNPSPQIISSGHFLKVKLKSYNGNAIFKASYSTGSSACGGEYYLDNGILTSPFYPNAVNMEMDCLYIIKGNPGTKIDLTIVEFARTNDNSYLFHDFLEIQVGNNSANKVLIGRFYTLAEIQNATMESTFNETVYLRFRSQGGTSTNAIKFLARYHINYISLFETDKGYLSSPQFGHVYSVNTRKTWTINPLTTQTINIEFSNFSVGRLLQNGECSRGKLIITGSNGESKSLCGSNLPQKENYSVPVVISLIAEGFRYPGFLLNWSTPLNESFIQTGNCMYRLQATQSPQILTSPSFPNFDHINRDCQWTIVAPKGKAISLRILNFTLEQSRNCKYENFTISFSTVFIKNQLNYYQHRQFHGYVTKTFCGTQNNSLLDYTDNYLLKTVTIRFQVDSLDLFPGFQLQYSLKCFQEINQIEGWLQNEEFPNNILAPKNCSYLLQLRTNRYFQLNFTSLNLPPKTNNQCNDGYLEIFARRRIERYCGSSIPSSIQPLITDSNMVFLRLVGSFNSSSIYNGFQMKYSLVENEECGGNHILSRNSDTITISSTGNVSASSDYMECKWYFVSPYGTRIKIDFQSLFISSNQCKGSFISLFDGSTILSRKIGNKDYCKKENSVFTTGNNLLMLFKNVNDHATFRIKVSIGICGGSLYRLKDTIITPNFPRNYPKNTICIWEIYLKMSHNIAIRFDDFSLNNNCTNTMVTISSEDNQSQFNYSSCNYPYSTLNIMSSMVKIVFMANSTSTGRGFKLSYKANPLRCGDILTNPSGEVKTINYPATIPRYVACSWYIKADITKRVTITIKVLTIRNYCLIIRNGQGRYIKRICGRNLDNYDIDTKSSTVHISIYGDGGNRLYFSYHTNLPSLCGSHIFPGTNNTGIITFTGDNGTSYCQHIVHNYDGSSGTVAFNVQNVTGLNCNSDSVTFQSIVSAEVGTNSVIDNLAFCEMDATRDMYATIGKVVQVTYNSFSRRNRSNYSVSILYKYQNCGGFLTESFGFISSPNYPAKYPHNSNCEWIIKSPENMHIRLVIHLLHLEQNQLCRFDHLIIRSGPEYNSPITKKLCNKNNITNETIIFRHNLIRISFTSDFSIAEDGFLIQYTFINAVDNCNGILFDTSGAIQSPNYPRPYPSNTMCNWSVIVPHGYKIQLTVRTPFDLEPKRLNKCVYDYVEIIDSNPEVVIAQLCGHIPPTTPFYSSENQVGVLFSSDHDLHLTGFRITYQAVCGGVFNYTFGEISSPNIFIMNIGYIYECNYTIPGWKGHLTVLKLRSNLYPCRYSYGNIEIWKEDYPGHYVFSQNICGKSLKDIIIFNQLSISIKFNVTFYWTKRFSFSARYLHDESIKVFPNFTTSTIIATPHFPTPYHHNADLQWQFYAPQNYIFHITIIKMDIESSPTGCIFDYVAFYTANNTNGSNLVETFCGKRDILIPFKIESNNILIHFVSDSSHFTNYSGFLAMISSSPGPQLGCGGSLVLNSASVGYISSVDLNNDGQYENRLICEWSLSVTNKYVIELRFENNSVSMERRVGQNCRFDWLNIYDGQYRGSELIRSICGNDTVDLITSSGSNLLLILNTDVSITGRGFRLRYSTILSPNNFHLNATNETQILTSPNYPDTTNYNQNIRAEIVAPSVADHILIEIKELLLRPSVNCSLDNFQLRDVSLRHTNQFRILCKPIQFVAPFISADNKVITSFHVGAPENENNIDRIQYKIEYKIYSCNRSEKAYSGRIFNIEKLKNNLYGHNKVCILTLEAPSSDLKFQFYFKKIMLENSPTCDYDYIQFTFGRPSEQQYTLRKICGNHLPPSIISNSSYVTMKFVTDGSISKEGFDITYVVNRDSQQKCGGDIDLDFGIITSPGFGRNFYESGHCIWNIALVSKKQLSWKITDLQLGLNLTIGRSCTSTTDYIQITYQDVVRKFCGIIYPTEDFEIQTSQMIVEYKSQNGGNGVGFKLEWKSILRINPNEL